MLLFRCCCCCPRVDLYSKLRRGATNLPRVLSSMWNKRDGWKPNTGGCRGKTELGLGSGGNQWKGKLGCIQCRLNEWMHDMRVCEWSIAAPWISDRVCECARVRVDQEVPTICAIRSIWAALLIQSLLAHNTSAENFRSHLWNRPRMRMRMRIRAFVFIQEPIHSVLGHSFVA